jgi:hypothetical protein
LYVAAGINIARTIILAATIKNSKINLAKKDPKDHTNKKNIPIPPLTIKRKSLHKEGPKITYCRRYHLH